MLLAIDIGNTNTVIGLYKNGLLKDSCRFSSRRNQTTDEAGLLLSQWITYMRMKNEQIEAVVIGSVVPTLTSVYESVAKEYCGCIPTVVTHDIALPVTIDIDMPHQLGADRIANAAAGFKKYGGDLIVVDFGTATTFDIVNSEGAYIGGIILPGPETSMGELARKAAQLFEVKITPPKQLIGKNTTQAIQSGIFYGTIGQVDYILEKLITEAGLSKPKIIATGGFARGIEKHSKHINLIDASLTLDGLYLIGELND